MAVYAEDLLERNVGRADVGAVGGALIDITGPEPFVAWRSAAITLDESRPAAGSRRAVRCFDIVGAITLLILTAPLMVLIALTIRLSGRGPVFFGSERIGCHNNFHAFKFRTMVRDAEAVLIEVLRNDPLLADEYRLNHKLMDDPRITRVGRFLRFTSLDELPQLLNVIWGHMSLVGPRPKLPGESLYYGEALPTILRVKPGLTGLWQTSGRNDLSFDERIMLDLTYATTRSFSMDIRLLLVTCRQLFSRQRHGAY